jgi:hypothetical protein
LERALRDTAKQLEGPPLAEVEALLGDGFEFAVQLLWDKVREQDAARILSWYANAQRQTRRDILANLASLDRLPAELFTTLQTLTSRARDDDASDSLAKAAAATGNPDVVAWLAHESQPASIRDNPIYYLVSLGRWTRAESVRTALRDRLPKAGGADAALQRSRILLRLLAMGDEPALQFVFDQPDLPEASRWMSRTDAVDVAPIAYVLAPPRGLEPPFPVAIVVREIPRLLASLDRHDPHESLEPRRIADAVLIAAIEQGSESAFAGKRLGGWPLELLRRIRADRADGPLRAWFAAALQPGGPGRRLLGVDLGESLVAAMRPQLLALIAASTATAEDLGATALGQLSGYDLQPPWTELRAHPNRELRALAFTAELRSGRLSAADAMAGLGVFANEFDIVTYLGIARDPVAVPKLLELQSKGDEGIRNAAAEALAKIRTFHEQLAYWDRVNKGLDASPTSAAEKLLLQSKPGAPAEQRLLAIRSLGALGVPEALPFLIEWTTDGDPKIAQAAKDAITEIHLQPRR